MSFPSPEVIEWAHQNGFIDDPVAFVAVRQQLADEAGMSLSDLHSYASCHVTGYKWAELAQDPFMINHPQQRWLIPLVEYQKLHNEWINSVRGGTRGR